MLLSAIFLILSVLVLAVMLSFRVWEIRVGRLSVSGEKIPETFFSADQIERAAEVFLKKARIFSVHTLAFLLSQFDILTRHIFETARKEWSKISKLLPKHLPHYLKHGSSSSVFLKDIQAHKEEIQKKNNYHE